MQVCKESLWEKKVISYVVLLVAPKQQYEMFTWQ
jgi:hypothetical protein